MIGQRHRRSRIALGAAVLVALLAGFGFGRLLLEAPAPRATAAPAGPGGAGRVAAPAPAPDPRPTRMVALRPPQAPLAPAAPQVPTPAPAWQRNAVPVTVPAGHAMIAVVIDDLGLDPARARRVTALPGPLTLAWLPYAPGLPRQTRAARAAGHELLVHMPMEPMDAGQDPGPEALRTDLPADEIRRRLALSLARFDGYVGINNHMGSRFTSDAQAMAIVLAELRERGLLFLDSRTTSASVAGRLAAEMKVPAAVRDVFLDHAPSAPEVRARLAQVEAVARRHGAAVAIGHPHDVTIEVLAEWLPTLAERGFALVPLSAVVRHRHAPH